MTTRLNSFFQQDAAIDAYRQLLLPQAELLTPNLHEARLLTGLAIETAAEVERAAERLLESGPLAVLIKGGGLAELRGRDFLLRRDGPGRHVGAGAKLAAGAVVFADVAPGVTVFGNPARVL